MRVEVCLSYYGDDRSSGQMYLVAAWLVVVGISTAVGVVLAGLEIVFVDLTVRVGNLGIFRPMAGVMAATRHRSIAMAVMVMGVRNLLQGT